MCDVSNNQNVEGMYQHFFPANSQAVEVAATRHNKSANIAASQARLLLPGPGTA